MSHPILDPLSFLAPGLIEPNLSLRELSDRGRDQQFNDDDLRCWKTSLASSEYFEFLKIPKWFKTSTFGSKLVYELHHFADAFSLAYAVSYFRTEDKRQNISCSFVKRKGYLAPSL